MPWTNSGGYKKDSEAFVFSLTGSMTVYKPANPDEAVYHISDFGPSFCDALGVYCDPMNEEDGGICCTKNNNDAGEYNIPLTSDGNSVLTGDGATSDPNDMRWTIAEIETFLLY